MAEKEPEFDPTDYRMAVLNRGKAPKPWTWEIYCAGKYKPVLRADVYFESMSAATREGKKALLVFPAATGRGLISRAMAASGDVPSIVELGGTSVAC